MKIKFQYIGLALLMFSMAACKKDNFKAPSSTLQGKLVYNGEAVQVQYDRVSYELYQYGFGSVGPIRASFAQDGSYSAILFDGQYKLIIPAGQGPFKWNETSGHRDSLTIDLNGSKTLDLEVTPYYMIRTPQLTAASNTVSAMFKAEKIITDASAKDIEEVGVYINKTQFVSETDYIEKTTKAGADIADPNAISLNVTIPAITPTQNYVFARIGLKVAGVEDRIYSPVVKLTF